MPEVIIKPSGHRFLVEPGETVLTAALRQGIKFPYGCRSGLCGSCKGRLLEGHIEYLGEPKALTPKERAAGYALFCRAIPLTDLLIELEELDPLKGIEVRTLPARVDEMERLAPDVMRLFLKLPEAVDFKYLPGQYIDVLLKEGKRRSYSMANPPHRAGRLEFHIRHVKGGLFTEHVFSTMKVRDILRIRGPLGNFYLREDSDRPVIFVAGGTGFAPIKAMLEHAFYEGLERPVFLGLDRPFHLYWGARTLKDLYLHGLPLQWEREHELFTYTPVLSEPLPEDRWEGRTGLVVDAVVEDHPDLSLFDVYASGPPAMVEAGEEAFTAQGLPLERYFYDAFTYMENEGP